MFLAMLLSQAVPMTQESAAPVASEDIVVTAQMRRDVRFSMRRDRRTGEGRCRITNSSGSERWDAIVCDQVVACMGTERITSEQFTACFNPLMQQAEEREALEKEARRRAEQ